MYETSTDSHSDERSGATSRMSAASRLGDDVFQDSAKFVLSRLQSVLFTALTCCFIVITAAGIIRSGIMLGSAYNKYSVLLDVDAKLEALFVVKDIADASYNEGFARMKYLTSGLAPEYFQELNDAVNGLDEVFNSRLSEINRLNYQAQEYKIYKCSYSRIYSNLAIRSEALPLTQYRTFDERSINPFDDVDFFDCLLAVLADTVTDAAAKLPSTDHIWNGLTAYCMGLRAVLSIKIVFLNAFITREMVLDKGSVQFARAKDAINLEAGLNIAQYLLQRADLVTEKGVGITGPSAILELGKVADEFTNIRNATKAYVIILNSDKYENTNTGKKILQLVEQTRDEYRDDILTRQHQAKETAIGSLISETIKLGVFIFILPPLLIIALSHFIKESSRLQNRYETCLERYTESCMTIFRLLPEPVAKKLNKGIQVRPEFYHNVSVLYSDIVGFTKVCSQLSAVNVLAMLNNIYTIFDSRTSAFRCYKIETIGDAYVVASGVPARNKDHASEVASLALVLVEEIAMIKVPKLGHKIRIRVGINSGPVIAGIVGTKMLRYCLFGNTVLYSNRLEATSQPQKIQISQSCHDELITQGGFTMHSRPEHEWPDGKPVFWLTGRVNSTLLLSIFRSDESQKAQVSRASSDFRA